MSVRVINTPVPEGKESADECLAKVKEVISEPGAGIPHKFIDRAQGSG